MDKNKDGAFCELLAAAELVKKGFRVYFPHQAYAKEDDIVAVNGITGNVYRVQVKSKKDKQKWSGLLFKGIKEKAHASWFFVLYERCTGNFSVVPSKDLSAMDADKNGFADEKGKYLGKWDLLK